MPTHILQNTKMAIICLTDVPEFGVYSPESSAPSATQCGRPFLKDNHD